MTRRIGTGGYSLFELVILIVVLGIVLYFIFVNSESIMGEPPEAREAAAAETIRIGIHNYAVMSKKMNRRPVYPAALDDAAPGVVAGDAHPLFTAIYPEGVRADWKKVGVNRYIYLPNAGSRRDPAEPFVYDSTRGTFEQGAVDVAEPPQYVMRWTDRR